jgi:tetratricopeptide (TPR) repeat protein
MGQPLQILIAVVFIVKCCSAIGLAESAAAAGVASQSQQLILARSLQQSGQFNSALAVLHDALSTLPNAALLLNQLGSVQQDLGQYLEAERSYLRALSAATPSNYGSDKLTIQTNLATLYLDTDQYSKGEQVREQLEKATASVLTFDPVSVARLMTVIGSLEHVRNRDDEAERYYSRSLAAFRQAQGSVSADAALVEANLGFLKLQAGHYDQAAGLFQQAIREIEIALDSKNPALLRPLICLATCENMRGNSIEAESAAERAVELSLQVFGEKHAVTATAMLQQAIALRMLHRKRQARKLEKCANAWLNTDAHNNLAGYTVELHALTSSTVR